jgi:hypothetical protein
MSDVVGPNDAANLDQVIEMLRGYLDQRNTGSLEINRRLDFLVSKLGGVEEMAHRTDLLEERAQKCDAVLQSLTKIVEIAQVDFDARTQVVLRDAEQLRSTMREAMTMFQKAQDDQNTDWDERWQALRNDFEKWKTDRAQEQASITVSKIGRSERVMIAVIMLLSTIAGIIATQILQQVK